MTVSAAGTQGISQGHQVVRGLSGAARDAHQVPALRGGQTLSMVPAQVIGVRLRLPRERPEHRGLVRVHVGQGADGWTGAGGAGAFTGGHGPSIRRPTPPTAQARRDQRPGLTVSTATVRSMASQDRDALQNAASTPRVRRRDRRGRGMRTPVVPAHMPGHRSRRQRFDDVVAEAAGALIERFPRRLEHLRVLVEDVPATDPAWWEEPSAALGRVLPATREHPPRVVLHRLPIQTRCTGGDLETMVRQVLAEQVGSLLGIAPEDVDPECWD